MFEWRFLFTIAHIIFPHYIHFIDRTAANELPRFSHLIEKKRRNIFVAFVPCIAVTLMKM